VQETQLAPHVVGSVSPPHVVPPQVWKPLSHLKPQLVPSHVAVLFAGGLQAVLEVPQLEIEPSLRHAPAQS
jgi:hypothetical protein